MCVTRHNEDAFDRDEAVGTGELYQALWDPAADYCFRPRDARLQAYVVVAAHFKPWAREWLLTTIHAVYALKKFQDGELRDCGLHPISLPDALLAYVHEEVAKQQLQDRWAFEKEVRMCPCHALGGGRRGS